MMKYPDELKREAISLAAQPGMKVAQVERDLGITPIVGYYSSSACIYLQTQMR